MKFDMSVLSQKSVTLEISNCTVYYKRQTQSELTVNTVIRTNQLMTHTAKVAVCSEIRAKQRKASTVVNARCYKPGGQWFDHNWCHWNFSLT